MKVLAVLLLLALLGGGGAVVYKQTRGLRNNNPGNLRVTGDNWNGLKGNDGEYFIFTDAKFGVRAMAITLKNYQRLHGLDTIREIINRWAPAVENNTSAYIAHVSQRLGIAPDRSLSVVDVLVPLVQAIIKHENGIQPYSDEKLALWVTL